MKPAKRIYVYRCAHCLQRVSRESTKMWVRSYCVRNGRYVRLMRVRR